jgi:hypothetical protein
MMTIQERIIEILTGRDHTNPMCREVLLDQLQAQGEDITDREMRMVVAEMVTRDGIPLGTNTRGYFMVSTVEDFEAADGEMRAKQEAIQARRAALLAAFQGLHRDNTAQAGQMGLFDTKTA